MTMKHTKIDIKTQKEQIEEFIRNKKIKQGDALSASLFNMALKYILQKVNKETLKTEAGQIIAYADDVVLIAKRRDIMETMVNKLLLERKLKGLQVNKEKTKIMRCRNKNEINKKIKIGQYKLEKVKKFNYSEVIVN